jgi:arylsulfatase A-like enzyme
MKANFLILILFPALFACTSKDESRRRPNILFIITDDQHDESFGFLEGKALTPRIDRMAREGMYFPRAYVAASVCTPSRYTCMTGQYASRCSTERFRSDFSQEGVPQLAWNMGLAEGQHTVSRVLQDEGYRTGFVGKWHVGGGIRDHFRPVPPGSDPEDPGIAWILRENHKGYCRRIMEKYGYDYADAVYMGNPNDDRCLVNTGCNVHNMEWLTRAAFDFIEEDDGRPFYLYFSTTLLHSPSPRESLLGDPRKCGLGLLDEPITDVLTSRASVIQRTKEAGITGDYMTGATWLDDVIGALLDKLEEKGLSENTLVVYFNDNGMETHAKGTCYEGGINVPVIAYWKGRILPAENDLFIQNIDFVPTFLEFARAEKPEDMIIDGVSLVPLLEGKVPGDWRTSVYTEIGYTRSVTTADWKYIALKIPPSVWRTREERLAEYKPYFDRIMEEQPWRAERHTFNPEAPYYHLGMQAGGSSFEWMQLDPDAPWLENYFDSDQLYHLSEDPLESTNLAGDPVYQGKLQEMRELLRRHLEDLPGTYGEMLE